MSPIRTKAHSMCQLSRTRSQDTAPTEGNESSDPHSRHSSTEHARPVKEQSAGSKAKRQETTRSKCLELISTEETYVRDMESFLKAYIRPALRMTTLTAAEKRQLASNLEDLVQCSKALLAELHADADPVVVVAKAFLTVAPFLKMYHTYCSNYEAALATQRAIIKRDRGFAKFLETQKAHVNNATFESCLIKPVQRIMRYPLFFSELIRLVPDDHEARNNLVKANELVQSVSSWVNASCLDRSLYDVVSDLGGHSFMQLIEPHRKLKLTMVCYVSTESRQFPAHIYVLSDFLLICEQQQPLQSWSLASPPRDLMRQRSGLAGKPRPWMLVGLTELLIGKEVEKASAGPATGSPMPAPTTPYSLMLACVRTKEAMRLDVHSSSAVDTLRGALKENRSACKKVPTAERSSRARDSSSLAETESKNLNGLSVLSAALDEERLRRRRREPFKSAAAPLSHAEDSSASCSSPSLFRRDSQSHSFLGKKTGIRSFRKKCNNVAKDLLERSFSLPLSRQAHRSGRQSPEQSERPDRSANTAASSAVI